MAPRNWQNPSSQDQTAGVRHAFTDLSRELYNRGWGRLDSAHVTSSQTGIKANTDLTNLDVTITVPDDNRWIRLSAHVLVQQVTNPGTAQLLIREGSTTLQKANLKLSAASDTGTFDPWVEINPSAGEHTYKLTLNSTANTVGTVASSDGPALLLAEDIGPVTPR